ncbi:MAG: pyridoxal-dependent decarboxylase [Isosphaeraceae bacterium]
MTPEEFRTHGHQLIDWIADYRSALERRPVRSSAEPGSIRGLFDREPPEEPIGFDAVLASLDTRILPGLTLWQHPSFFGYFPCNGTLGSVLGDFLSTGLGVLGLSWQSSPALTEVEEVVTDWVRQALGLDAGWSGVIQDTASTSTLVALLCARERASGFSLDRGGLQGEPSALVVYASAQAHSSVEKAALLAGFGRVNVRAIATDASYALVPSALEASIRDDLDAGRVPCAIVATTGTTATTAVDPIRPIAEIAARYGVWLHVDSAMAGSAMILPECRWMWEGIETADSIVVNAHKWLGAAFDCSLSYVRDPEHLVRVMSTNPSYLRTAEDGRVTNYRDWGIPLGRRFRALKLWSLFVTEGLSGLRARLRRDLENARWLAAQAEATPGWRVMAPVHLQTVCLRFDAPGLEGEALDRFTLDWCERINRSGLAYLTPALVGERWLVRVSIGAEATERAHVEQLWDRLRAEAETH